MKIRLHAELADSCGPHRAKRSQKKDGCFYLSFGMTPTFKEYNVLSRASEVGSPTSSPWAPGSDKTRVPAITTDKNLKKETDRTFDPLFTKTG